MRRVILSLLCLGFALIGTLGLITLFLRQTVFHADFYKTELRKYAIYDAVYEELSLQLAKQSPVRVAEDEHAAFTMDELRITLEASFPPAWLQEHVELLLDTLDIWLDSDEPDLTFTMDVRVPKQAFGRSLKKMMTSKFETLPVCKMEELAKLLENHNQLLQCKPPGMTLDAIWAEFEPRYLSVVAAIPDDVSLPRLLDGELIGIDLIGSTEAAQVRESIRSNKASDDEIARSNYGELMIRLHDVREALEQLDRILFAMGAVCLFLLLLIWFTTWRKPLRLLHWTGIAVTGLGTDLLIISILLATLRNHLAPTLQNAAREILSADLRTASIEIPLDLIRVLGDKMLMAALTGIGAGMVLLIARVLINLGRSGKKG